MGTKPGEWRRFFIWNGGMSLRIIIELSVQLQRRDWCCIIIFCIISRDVELQLSGHYPREKFRLSAVGR